MQTAKASSRSARGVFDRATPPCLRASLPSCLSPRSAFTIIELLVVISIIIILIALLLPGFAKSREVVRQVVCKTNLNQMGVAFIEYQDDFDYLPPSYLGPDAVWPALLRIYMGGETDVFYCPTAKPEARWEVTFGSGLPEAWGYEADEVRRRAGGGGSWPFSYGHNNGGTADGSTPPLGVGDPFNDSRYVHVGRVVQPDDFMVIGDSLIDGVWDHFIDEDVPGEEPAVRHDEGAFILFADGHTEHIIPGPYLDLANTRSNPPEFRRRWNNDNQPH